MPDSSPEQRNAAVAVATAALREVTGSDTIGELLGVEPAEDQVVNVVFACALKGYPGWRWTVSVSTVDGAAPSVLELDLLPGDGALVAPEWVPWADRLAHYEAGQLREDDSDDDDSDDDELDDDESDDDDLTDLDELDDELDDLDDIDGVDFELPDDADVEAAVRDEDADVAAVPGSETEISASAGPRQSSHELGVAEPENAERHPRRDTP